LDEISIPYGAIKSMQQQVQELSQDHISIPYGAIKRMPQLPS